MWFGGARSAKYMAFWAENIFQKGVNAFRGWAKGRHSFLRPWAEQALAGGVLGLSPIRAALAQRLGGKWLLRLSTGFWPAMAGERWRRIRVIPTAIRKFKKLGEKTPGRLGGPVDSGRRRDAQGTDHVSRRGSLRTNGTDSTLLVTGAVSSDGRQRLRTAVHVCLWSGQSNAGRIGLDDQPEDEHRTNEPIPPTSESGPSGGIHRHDGCGT